MDPETVRYFDEPHIWAKVTGHYEKTVLERVTFDVFELCGFILYGITWFRSRASLFILNSKEDQREEMKKTAQSY